MIDRTRILGWLMRPPIGPEPAEGHHFTADYNAHAADLERRLGQHKGMRAAIGGNFIPFGLMQMNLLRQYGLTGEEYVIDVGCGSGRLPNALTRYSALRYLGTDVVDQFLEYARTITNRADWRFERTSGLNIPSPDAQADFVTFFSVFTHLLHEESYTLLLEARRVLKPGGHIIFSFLDFAEEGHWSIFEDNLRTLGGSTPLNMFLGRKAIRVWARHLNFELIDLFRGSEPHIRLPEPVPLDNGSVATELGTMGQSVAVYRKPTE